MKEPDVAIVHDYLTQRGGAERVVLSMMRAFPGAPLYTSLYDEGGTFREFGELDVRPLWLNRVGPFRRSHELALPLLAPAFTSLRVNAKYVLCSSSGWAHGARTSGRKVVYCHNPARWLYQTDRYLRDRGPVRSTGLAALRRPLLTWDRHAARSAHRYLANSRVVQARIRDAYGIQANVLNPPQTLDPDLPQEPVAGVAPGYFLCVSRLLPYKNVDAILAAFAMLPEERLVVVGYGPHEAHLRRTAPPTAILAGQLSDAQLRWLYANCAGLVAASYEDYGLTPLEAAAFGKPSAVLRFGGFLDTVVPDKTGVFFASPTAAEIAASIVQLRERDWPVPSLRSHAEAHSEARFIERLRQSVFETE